ncbi:hypothetical protein X801_08799, partial [Opisthorchis viverrini]
MTSNSIRPTAESQPMYPPPSDLLSLVRQGIPTRSTTAQPQNIVDTSPTQPNNSTDGLNDAYAVDSTQFSLFFNSSSMVASVEPSQNASNVMTTRLRQPVEGQHEQLLPTTSVLLNGEDYYAKKIIFGRNPQVFILRTGFKDFSERPQSRLSIEMYRCWQEDPSKIRREMQARVEPGSCLARVAWPKPQALDKGTSVTLAKTYMY